MGDRHLYGSRTRFIGNAMLPCFEQLSWPIPPEGSHGTPGSRQAAIDLAQRMRDMWR
jgi:DNA helicase-2/ATP-dependent DNA helicase PcrA